MAYETFPTTISPPSDIEIVEVCNTLRSPFQAGYVQTRAKNQRLIKRFAPSWNGFTPTEWMELLEFWYDRKGGAEAFYWQYPMGIYGVPGFGGSTDAGIESGWQTEVEIGFGEGPIKLVRFAEDELRQPYKKEYQVFGMTFILEMV